LATPGAEIARREDGLTTDDIMGTFEKFIGRGGRGKRP
jgi:hypothetical protein